MPSRVTRLSEAQAVRLVRFYEHAEREILDRLNRALLKANKTEYLAAMKKNIETILQQLRAGSRTWCTEAIPRVYVQGATMADRMITEAGFDVKAGAGFGAIHQQAAQVLAENAFESLDNVAQAIGRQTNDIYRELALENVRGTVVGYDTWKQTARNFREQLAERGVTGFKDRAGREWNMRSYAEMVARTTIMESHLQGTANRLAEQGHDLVKISSHVGACELCIPWEGKVLSLTGKTPDYPSLAEAKAGGLFHPNCYSEDTEVYTDRGWMLFADLLGDEKVLSMDPKTRGIEWADYTSTVAYHFVGSMIELKSNSLDLLVTPDHSMYVGMNSHYKNKRTLKYRLMPAGELKGRNFKIPRTARWEGTYTTREFMGIPIKQFAKLLGYFLSEGCADYSAKRRTYRVDICQHNRKNRKLMLDDLQSIGFYECGDRLVYYNKDLSKYFTRFGRSYEKYIPEWFLRQPPEVIRLFLDAFALGDGSTREIVRPEINLKSIEREYFTSSPRLADQLGEAILKTGSYPSFKLQKSAGKTVRFENGPYVINHDVWRIRENTSPHSVHNASPSCRHRGIQMVDVPYDGMVYCVELERNHVMWVRRNGKAAWCGNCRHAYGLSIDLDAEIEGAKPEAKPEAKPGPKPEPEAKPEAKPEPETRGGREELLAREYREDLLDASSHEAAVEMLKAHGKQYSELIGIDEMDAIETYQSDAGYRAFNRYLRGRDMGIHDKDLEQLDRLVELTGKATIETDVIAARGIPERILGEKGWKGIGKDDIIEEKGFMSASLRQDTAEGFMRQHGEEGVLMMLKVPKGTNGISVDAATKVAWESELLLKPGTRVLITGKKTVKGVRVVEGVVLGG